MSVRKIPGTRDTYRVQVYNPYGPNVDRRVRGRRKADALEAQVTADYTRGLNVDIDAGRETFRAYTERWLTVQPHRQSTRELYRRILRLHIYPALGDRPLGGVKHSEARGFVTGLERTLGANVARQAHALTRTIFTAAVNDEILPRSPFRGIRLPNPRPRAVERFMAESFTDVRALLDALPEDLRALATLGAGSGLRLAEMLGLTVDDVDFLRRREVRVRQQVINLSGRGIYLDEPKTTDSVRTVPLPQFVLDALAAHMAARPPVTVELPWGALDGPTRKVPLIFTTDRGAAMRGSTVDNRFSYWTRKADLPAGFTPHVLRHLYTSVLHDAGIPQRVIDAYTGHVPTGITQRVYTHVMNGAPERVRNALDTSWREALIGDSRNSERQQAL